MATENDDNQKYQSEASLIEDSDSQIDNGNGDGGEDQQNTNSAAAAPAPAAAAAPAASGISPLHASPSDVAALPDPDDAFAGAGATSASAYASAYASASSYSPPQPELSSSSTMSLDVNDPNHPTNFSKPNANPYTSSSSSSDPTTFQKPTKQQQQSMDPSSASIDSQYILGTLIIRVVSARALELPPGAGGGPGGGLMRQALSFASGQPAGCGCNPYASVRFNGSTQRTSEVFDSLDPVWPRQETMFMDVSLPLTNVTHPDPTLAAGSDNLPGEETDRSSAASSSVARSSSAMGDNSSNNIQNDESTVDNPYASYTKPDTTLTVAMFSNPEIGRAQKFPSKAGMTGDSDDLFLGVSMVDLTNLLTGKVGIIDRWFPLRGGSNKSSDDHRRRHAPSISNNSCVRIVCEYEPSDGAPKAGDICRFTRFCHPRDLYPLEPGRAFKVEQVHDDILLLSYESQEGWVLSFRAHKNMLLCEERHQSAIENAQDELATLRERLAYSPLVSTVTQTADKVTEEGILGVGEEIARGGAFVLQRWFTGGLDTVISDIQNVTNIDGRYNPDAGERLGLIDPSSSDALTTNEDRSESPENDMVQETNDDNDDNQEEEEEALPNMPPCPITGFPMVEPVVAADGHTYERVAIQRWLTTSDKSPMTGSILVHKELVPNYGLMSSVQEMAAREKEQRSKVASPAGLSKKDGTTDTGNLKKPPPPPPPPSFEYTESADTGETTEGDENDDTVPKMKDDPTDVSETGDSESGVMDMVECLGNAATTDDDTRKEDDGSHTNGSPSESGETESPHDVRAVEEEAEDGVASPDVATAPDFDEEADTIDDKNTESVRSMN